MASPAWIQCDFIQTNPRWIDSTCGAASPYHSEFHEQDYDHAAARRFEMRRQILHEDQIMSDLIVQAVTSRMLE